MPAPPTSICSWNPLRERAGERADGRDPDGRRRQRAGPKRPGPSGPGAGKVSAWGFAKPAEGSWTEHYPELGTAPISHEASMSPAFYELEGDAIFKRVWLNVGRVEQLPRNGSYFTKELAVAKTSVIVVRGLDGEVRAFHNICRHRGNKLVWQDYP